MLLLSPDQLPASVSIYTFFGKYGQVVYGQLAAYSILYSPPVVLLYVLWPGGWAGLRARRRGQGVRAGLSRHLPLPSGKDQLGRSYDKWLWVNAPYSSSHSGTPSVSACTPTRPRPSSPRRAPTERSPRLAPGHVAYGLRAQYGIHVSPDVVVAVGARGSPAPARAKWPHSPGCPGPRRRDLFTEATALSELRMARSLAPEELARPSEWTSAPICGWRRGRQAWQRAPDRGDLLGTRPRPPRTPHGDRAGPGAPERLRDAEGRSRRRKAGGQNLPMPRSTSCLTQGTDSDIPDPDGDDPRMGRATRTRGTRGGTSRPGCGPLLGLAGG